MSIEYELNSSERYHVVENHDIFIDELTRSQVHDALPDDRDELVEKINIMREAEIGRILSNIKVFLD